MEIATGKTLISLKNKMCIDTLRQQNQLFHRKWLKKGNVKEKSIIKERIPGS